MTRTPSGTLVAIDGRAVSPRGKSKRSKTGSPRRRPSISAQSDGNSEYYPEEQQSLAVDYYSGLEDGSSDEDDDDSSDEDDLMDLDLQDNLVTGFAVASSRRNLDFHELFPSVPEGDYLIEGVFLVLSRVSG